MAGFYGVAGDVSLGFRAGDVRGGGGEWVCGRGRIGLDVGGGGVATEFVGGGGERGRCMDGLKERKEGVWRMRRQFGGEGGGWMGGGGNEWGLGEAMVKDLGISPRWA